MTKKERIGRIVRQTGGDAAISQFVVEAFFEVVKTTLSAGDTIDLRRFGRFGPKRRARKVARTINQNTALVVEAHTIPHFKPSPEFAEQVSQGATSRTSKS